MATETLERTYVDESMVITKSQEPFMTPPRSLFGKIGGRLVSKLIAERRSTRTNSGHQEKLDKLARKLSPYEGILPDPFNPRRRLVLDRLISQIDRRIQPK